MTQEKKGKGRNQIKSKYSCVITMNTLEKFLFRLAIIDVLNYIFKWNEDKEIISIKRERLPTRVSSGELRRQLIISNCPSTKCTICRQAVIYKLEAMRGKEHSGPHFSSQTKPFSSLKAWEGTLHFLSLAYISSSYSLGVQRAIVSIEQI